jgi:hypothetical protein
MRKLDLEEKQFLTEVVRHYQNGKLPCLADLVDNYLVSKDIQIAFNTKTAEVHFDQYVFLSNNNLPDYARQISWTLMKLVNLLKYLQDLGYLYLWKEANNNPIERYGQLVSGNPIISQNINDSHIAGLLVEYSFRTIILGQTLIEYVHNDYQTTEDLQFKENIKIANASLETARQSITQANESIVISKESLVNSQGSLTEARRSVSRATIAIWLSVIMTLSSIAASFYLVNYQTEKPMSIDSKQIEQVLKGFNEMEKKVETISDNLEKLKLPDTVKTTVVNPIKIETKK